jgi:hypothetical protein
VLVDSPDLARVTTRPDPAAFRDHLAPAPGTNHVAVFENLGGDAVLVR